MTTKTAPVELPDEITYHLTRKVSYSRGGEQVEGQFVVLYPPTSKHSRECASLKQAFFRAAAPHQEKARSAEKDEKDSGTPTGPEIMAVIAQSPDVDLADVLDVAKKLFLSLAKLDGEEKITPALLDRISQDDLEGMVGAYLVGFTLASTFSRT